MAFKRPTAKPTEPLPPAPPTPAPTPAQADDAAPFGDRAMKPLPPERTVVVKKTTSLGKSEQGLRAVDEAELEVTEDWRISKYRSEWVLAPGDRVTMVKQEGDSVLLQISPGTRILVPIRDVEANTRKL